MEADTSRLRIAWREYCGATLTTPRPDANGPIHPMFLIAYMTGERDMLAELHQVMVIEPVQGSDDAEDHDPS